MNCYTCSVVIHFRKFGIRFFVLDRYLVCSCMTIQRQSMRTLRTFWNRGHDCLLSRAEFNVNSTAGRKQPKRVYLFWHSEHLSYPQLRSSGIVTCISASHCIRLT